MKDQKNIEFQANKNIENGIGEWTVTFKAEAWQDLIKGAERKVVAELQIPGFRKGKVPSHIAKDHVKDSTVLQKASQKAITKAYDLGMNEDVTVKPMAKPEVELVEISKEVCTLKFTFDLPLSVNLKSYANFDLPKTSVAVEESEINEQIIALKNRFAVYAPKEAPLELGDVAVFDFVGTVDGEEFPGGKAENAELEIGSNRFIPGFETQMIGMQVGEEKTITVTFPADYQVAKLANADAQFKINLKEVKMKTVTENDEELVKDANLPGVTSFAELKTFITNEITKQKEKKVRDEFMEVLFTKIVSESEIIIPKSVIDKEIKRLRSEFEGQLKQQNVSLEDYMRLSGIGETEINAELKNDAVTQLQAYLITEEVIKGEKITTTEDEIDTYLENVAQQFNMSLVDLKKNVKDFSFVANDLNHRAAINWLYENNGTAN